MLALTKKAAAELEALRHEVKYKKEELGKAEAALDQAMREGSPNAHNMDLEVMVLRRQYRELLKKFNRKLTRRKVSPALAAAVKTAAGKENPLGQIAQSRFWTYDRKDMYGN